MINLLPPETRENYKYARRNRKLIPWVIVPMIVLVGLFFIALYGSASQERISNNYKQQINNTRAELQKKHVDEVKTKINDISNSLKLVVSVLGREVLFSKLLQQITTVVPPGVNLSGLNINQADGAIDIVAKAHDYGAATQLQANLTDPDNQIFSKADLVSVNCQAKDERDPEHPCTVNIRALFGDNKQFLFINEGKS